MKFIFITLAFLTASTSSFAQEEANILILSLQSKSDDKVVSRIDLYANDIDPNSVSVDDKLRLEIDGKTVNVPEGLLRSLDTGRREYSYDSFTGGIAANIRGAVCRMGGPARGEVLFVRYLTYKEFSIERNEMLPVLSGGNCLFTEIFHPVNAESKEAAAVAMAILKSIKVMQPKQ